MKRGGLLSFFLLYTAVSPLLLSCGDGLATSAPETKLRAEGRHTALVVHSLLQRISLYNDRLLPVTSTWSAEEVTAPLGDRYTFYSPPEIARDFREKEQNPQVEDGAPLPTVFVDSVAPGLSLIQVTEFRRVTIKNYPGDTTGTWREFRQALWQTRHEEVTLIDLRNNPGGSVMICLGMADELVPDQRVLVTQENRAAPWNGKPLLSSLPSSGGGLGEERRFVFLANHRSASCSELFLASALGNREDRFVGQTTFGKGVGQSLWTLPDGGMLRATSLLFWAPDGISWNGVGIAPDVEKHDREEQLQAAIELAHQMKNDQSSPLPPRKLEERLFARSAHLADLVGSVAEFSPRPAEEIVPLDSIYSETREP